MKLLHKQLLTTGAPYLVLIISVFLLHAWWIEPMVTSHFRRETLRELNQHAGHMRLAVERAKSQLRPLTESSLFRGGAVDKIVEELRRIEPQAMSSFGSVAYCDMKLIVHAADGSTDPLKAAPSLEEMAAGEDIVTDVRFSRATGKPVFLILLPIQDEMQQVNGFVVGELPVGDLMGSLPPAEQESDTLQILQIGRANQFLTVENVATATTPADFFWPLANDPPLAQAWTNFQNHVPADRLTRSRLGASVGVQPLNSSLVQLTPRREVLGPTRLLSRFALGIATLGMLCSLILVWLQNRAETSRLENLTESLQRFGAGNDTIRSTDQTNDEIGRLAGAFNCMVEDQLHSRRKLQKQLAEHAEVAHDRKDRTAELQAQVDELERYAAAVAHDVRAPLVTMQGFVAGLETAARSGDWDRFQEDVERIRRIGDTLQKMSESLLESARISDAAVVTETVALHQAASDAVELLRGLIDQSAVGVTISDKMPIVQGDPARWRQVFQNLIDNAVKACAGVSGARIEIGCEERTVEHHQAHCCFVRDNGAGLSSEQIKTLSSGPAKQIGSGIGLALVKRTIERHGGRIWAESNGPGKGTTVWWTVGTRED